jgi:crotonobetainyl-CoA:carnitine CoA-transferase CaiB-like acyl-CoA transferase
MAPLAGLRVLDLSRVLAGPYCTMLLADLGADVVKVERPGTGDDTREWGPPGIGGEAAYFLAVNRSKRSCALDLATPEGRAVAARLAARSDVVIENFRAGTAARLGLAYEQLRELNPRLVYCSITGFGSDREPPDRPGYDFVVQAESGLMAITGEADGEPTKVGVALVDVLAGVTAAVGILAALRARDESGAGDRLEVPLLDVALSGLVNVAAGALVTGAEPGRFGNAHPSIVPYQTFRAADGWIAVAAANDALFARLCDVVERPGLADDPRFRTNPDRVRNRAELVAVLDARFVDRPAAEWLNALAAAGVPAGKVRGVLEALREAAATGRPVTTTVEHPSAGALELVGAPIRLGSGLRPAEPPPLLGEHTESVLAEAGYSADEISALERRGVVTRAAPRPRGPST